MDYFYSKQTSFEINVLCCDEIPDEMWLNSLDTRVAILDVKGSSTQLRVNCSFELGKCIAKK